MHLLEVAVELEADDTQHIVVEDTGINTTDDEGLIGLVLYTGERLTEFGCQLRSVHAVRYAVVHDPDAMEHRLVHRLQHHVVSSLEMSLDLFYGRLQGVGRNVHHRLGTEQFGLQQLTVGFLLRSLLDDLLQHGVFRLGQVFFLRLSHLLPK